MEDIMYEWDFDLTDTIPGMIFWSYRAWFRKIRKTYKADRVVEAEKQARRLAFIEEAKKEHARWVASQEVKA